MSKIYDSEIGKMQHLINYGLKEGTSNEGKPIVEYHAQGADGKTYGILRECNKFYIKVAPKKDTEILAEDYDYIGGYMNKKMNEYTTYAVASKNFDLKMKQLAESVGSKKAIEQFSTVKPAEWQINETKEMRAEIDRFNQIVNNSKLIEEGKQSNVNEATNMAVGLVGKGPDDDTFTEKPKGGEPKGRKGNKPGSGAPFIEPAKPDNGKKKNESLNRTVKLTEEQVLAWNRGNDNFVDKSEDTSVGSSEPYTKAVGCESNQCEADTDPIKEGVAMHNSDNQNVPEPGTSERGRDDDDPFIEIVTEDKDDIAMNVGNEIDPSDVYGMEGMEDGVEFNVDDKEPVLYDDDEGFEGEENVDDVPFPDALYNKDAEKRGMRGLENWEETWNQLPDEYDDDPYDDPFEGRSHRGDAIVEVVLNDFGKHPAYRKRPMTTPTHKIADRFGKDWNDDSAKGDEPFGKQIGSSAPYDEKLVKMITDAVVDMVSKKKD